MDAKKTALRRFRRLAFLVLMLAGVQRSPADLASDNADNDPYPATGFLPGDNGGSGFTGWVALDVGTPGSMYTTTAIDDGTYSWGLGATYALGRGLSNSLIAGSWRLLAQHDADNTSFSGFNLRSAVDVGGGFADYELFRFGMDASQPGYDGTGIYISTNGGSSYDFLGCGWVDGAGDTIEYIVSWNGNGLYGLSVSNVDEGVTSMFSGNTTTGSVAMLGVAVSGASLNESIAFDDYRVIPEPAHAALLGCGAVLLCSLRRKKCQALSSS